MGKCLSHKQNYFGHKYEVSMFPINSLSYPNKICAAIPLVQSRSFDIILIIEGPTQSRYRGQIRSKFAVLFWMIPAGALSHACFCCPKFFVPTHRTILTPVVLGPALTTCILLCSDNGPHFQFYDSYFWLVSACLLINVLLQNPIFWASSVLGLTFDFGCAFLKRLLRGARPSVIFPNSAPYGPAALCHLVHFCQRWMSADEYQDYTFSHTDRSLTD